MKATDRISQALALFTPTSPERLTADVGRLLGVANSTAHDLLNGLADAGLLTRVAPGRFRLGPKVAQMAATLQSSDTLIEASRGVLVELAHNYGETCHVFVLSDQQLVSMTSTEGIAVVRAARGAVGQETPVYTVAPGKLLMSALPLAELSRLIGNTELLPRSPATITQKSLLRDQVASIRSAEYADEIGEYDQDLATTAAPIRNHSGSVVAALSLLVPASRFERQRRAYRNICIEAARKISTRMGWVESGPEAKNGAALKTIRESHLNATETQNGGTE